MTIRNVLVCDDSETDRANLERILLGAGYSVATADCGETAIALARSNAPDVIFMDVNMAGTDGFAATRALQKDPATVAIPIVMVTSKNQKADHVWARLQGARGYVAKPYTDAQILDQVAALDSQP